jgi:glutamine synthetase
VADRNAKGTARGAGRRTRSAAAPRPAAAEAARTATPAKAATGRRSARAVRAARDGRGPRPSTKQIVERVKADRVKYVHMWFTDILGMLKSFAITLHELETALEEGQGFDGSSIEGYTRIQESDMLAVPDPRTYQVLPWKQDGQAVARMFCDVTTPDGEPYDGDPRWVLKRALAKAREMGFTFHVGPELEYFYFPSAQDPTPLDRGGYFDMLPLDFGSDLRKETIRGLESMGIQVEYSHHEVAPSQHEIDLRYSEALEMADHVMSYKAVVKRAAYERGIYATFMPKPIQGVNGSGMHCHQSLFDERGRNVFFDARGKHHLSRTALQYIAGVMRHARENAIVTNQWVNSYKRLVPGYEAPVYITWANANRSAMIRVPQIKPGKEKATRIEVRNPDPACNPYLAFAVMLAAGLKGIEEGYEPVDPVDDVNIFHLTDEAKAARGIHSLPEDLLEAIRVAERSELLREALGEHVFEQLMRNKRVVWDDYKARVSRYEVEYYLPIL